MSTSTNTTNADLLPPPPQKVVGGITPAESDALSNGQFRSLLALIGGKKKRGKSMSRRVRRSVRRSIRRSVRRSRRSMRNRKSRKSRKSRRKYKYQGGNTMQVTTPPVSYKETSYPSVTDISKQLAGNVAQNNANTAYDNNVGVPAVN